MIWITRRNRRRRKSVLYLDAKILDQGFAATNILGWPNNNIFIDYSAASLWDVGVVEYVANIFLDNEVFDGWVAIVGDG